MCFACEEAGAGTPDEVSVKLAAGWYGAEAGSPRGRKEAEADSPHPLAVSCSGAEEARCSDCAGGGKYPGKVRGYQTKEEKMRKFEKENEQAGGGCCGVTGGTDFSGTAKAAFLMLGALFLSGVSENALAQCVATTDCATLGYTESSCPDGGVKCPFGDKWACLSGSSGDGGDDADKPGSVNNDTDCTYGSIYYNDGVCYSGALPGRSPIGVVTYVDPISGEKWIMSLDSRSRNWGGKTDIAELKNYTSANIVISDVKSCENTDALLKAGSNIADYVYAYAPEAAPETKGKWCLPAAGMLHIFASHQTEINNGLAKVGYSGFGEGDFWTSSEYGAEQAWMYRNASKDFVTNWKYNSKTAVAVMRIK